MIHDAVSKLWDDLAARTREASNGGRFDGADPGEMYYSRSCSRNGTPRISVTREEGEILAELARDRDVLEIGTGLAVSTRYLARTARRVVTVDVDPWVEEYLAKSAPLPENVEFRCVVPPVESKFDLAFIDGCHLQEHVEADIAACVQRLRPDGLLVFHDLFINDVVEAIKAAKLEQSQHYKTACQLGVYKRPSNGA